MVSTQKTLKRITLAKLLVLKHRVVSMASLWSRSCALSVRSCASRPSVHAIAVRRHGGDMFVTGIVKSVNFAFFSGAIPLPSLRAHCPRLSPSLP